MHQHRPTRRGLSLIELVLSLGVVSVLAVSMTSVMVLTSRAIPTNKDRDQQATRARANLDILESDLAMAIAVSSVTASGFTIEVPDRTGDSLAETIVYDWEDPGKPLTRSMNGSSPAIVLESADQLEIQFTTETRTTTIPSGTVDSSEVVLASYTAATNQQLPANALTVQALCVVPLLDSDVTHWRLTRLRHAFTPTSGSATSYTATVHPQNPSGDIDELSQLASASNTPNPNASSMQDISFSNVTWQSRDRRLWVVIRPGALSQFTLPAQSAAADPSYTRTGTVIVSLTSWTIGDRNVAWSYEALGEVRRPGTTTVSTTHATAARVRALLPTGEYLLIQPRMWNEPEVQ